MRIATDIGGTFTDLVFLDEVTGEIRLGKTSTTVGNPENGILDALDRAGTDFSKVNSLIHGSTVVINIITERKGAKTGLLTTRGFRDVLEIARHNRPDMYNLYYKRPEPLVPRHLRLEVDERIAYNGIVLKPTQTTSVKSALEVFRLTGVQSVAVCLLNAYSNPVHEKEIGEILIRENPELHVSLSHKIANEWREYERTSTVVLNAYVAPVARSYIEQLEAQLIHRGLKVPLHIMQSNGGTMTAQSAVDQPIQIIESGPVAGVIGAQRLGRLLENHNIISLDMGGTTTKVSLVEADSVKFTTEYRIGARPGYPGYPVQIPVVDIIEIGAGGGSVAWIDAGGAMRVGPQSAGAMPGPACYGLGGIEPTITDANLVLGRINPNYFLGGEIKLDQNAANQAIARVADKLAMAPNEVAMGIVRITESTMVGAVSLISVQRGHNPKDFAIVAFGGAGPMHAAALANELEIPQIIIPRLPGHFSAWGMLLCDLQHDYVKTQVQSVKSFEPSAFDEAFGLLEENGKKTLLTEGIPENRFQFRRTVDMRYLGQEHSVNVPSPDGKWNLEKTERLIHDFHQLHEKRYAFSLKEAEAELVALRVVAIGITDKPSFTKPETSSRSPDAAIKGNRKVYIDGPNPIDVPLFERSKLGTGNRIVGPAIIEEEACTTILQPRQQLFVDEYGNLVIRRTS